MILSAPALFGNTDSVNAKADPKTSRSVFLALLLVVLLLPSTANAVLDDVCVANDDALLSNTRVQGSFSNVIRRFNSTCVRGVECDQDVAPVELNMILDYRNMPVGLMRSSCQRQRDYKMCRVNTKTRFTGAPGVPVVGGVDIGTYILELGKPACFPPTCSDGQANVVEPNPARCRPGGTGQLQCEVVSYEVDCGGDREVAQGNCQGDLLSATSPFFIQRTLYEGTVFAECATAFAGNPTSLCKFGYEDVRGNVTGDMTDFVSHPSYAQHERQCQQAGGVLCRADVETELRVTEEEMEAVLDQALASNNMDATIENYGVVVLRGEVVGLPQCFPPSCDVLRDAETLFVRHAERLIADRGFPLTCDRSSGRCEVSVSNVRCDGAVGVPSTFSPDATRRPTASPVLMSSPEDSSPSASPSLDDSSPRPSAASPADASSSFPSAPPNNQLLFTLLFLCFILY